MKQLQLVNRGSSGSKWRGAASTNSTSRIDLGNENDSDTRQDSKSEVKDNDDEVEEIGLLSMDREQENIKKSTGKLSQLKEIVQNL